MTTAIEVLKHEASKTVNPGFPDANIWEFHPEGGYWGADPDKHQLSECDEDLLESMAGYLRDAVNGDLDISGALEIRVYREANDPDSYVMRVVLTTGGPYIAIEYDADDSRADIVGYSIGSSFRIREYGTDLAELCQELAELC